MCKIALRNCPGCITCNLSRRGQNALVVKNLYKLKNKGEPFSGMIIKHDMSRDDREKERLLQKEARERTQQEQNINFVYLVR